MTLNNPGIKFPGIDEAGRGCLWGPVVAGCIALPDDAESWEFYKDIKDSKKLSRKKRSLVRDKIIENCDTWGIGVVSAKCIDEKGILPATMLAMHRAVRDMLERNPNVSFEKLMVDGTTFTPMIDPDIIHECIIDGDAKYANIAAASIIAKEHHDMLITEACDNDITLDMKYGFKSNKCYGTKAHMEGLKKYGVCEGHRLSFKPCGVNLYKDLV